MPASRPRSLAVQSAEWVSIAAVVYSPWHFGSVTPQSHLILHFFLVVLSMLYAVEIATNPSAKWINCPVGILLASLLLWLIVQFVPLPSSVVEFASPYRAGLWPRLVPSSPEQLSAEMPVIPLPPASISADPFISRNFARLLLYIFLFYSLLRNFVVSRSFFRKLAYACLGNMAALSIVAMAIHFGSSPKRVLGILDVDGPPFGPFINRDHFAFYANLCLGLSLGLLSGEDRRDKQGYRQEHLQAKNLWDTIYAAMNTLFAILQNPRSFWILGLSLIAIAATILTQSRGSYIAALAGAVFCLFVRYRQSTKQPLSLGLLLPFGLGLVGVAIFTSSFLETKVTDVSVENWDNRSDLWRDTSKLVPMFGLVGSGGGTYSIVEPVTRQSHSGANYVYDHAHNEYLEALVEGGLPRLILTLALVSFVLYFAIRACKVHSHRTSRGFAYGCLFGLTATTVHSIGEFGVHIGSIAILLTVLTASAVSLTQDYDGKPSWLGRSRPTAWLAAITIPLLAGLMTWQAWKADSAYKYRRLAEVERESVPNPTSLSRRLIFSEAALAAEPNNPALLLLRGDCLADSVRGFWNEKEKMRAAIQPALASWISSRNLSPLQPQPHARLGIYRDFLRKADSASAYFERAKLLVRIDPQIWYVCGLSHFEAGEYSLAWLNWKEALRLGTSQAASILRKSRQILPPNQLVELVIPSDLAAISAALEVLYPESKNRNERRPFVARAVELLQASNDEDWNGEMFHKAARFYAEFDQWEPAIKAYRNALFREPQRVSWRVELAQTLRLQGRPQQAREELLIALAMDEKTDLARYWLLYIEREIELRK